MYDKDIQYHLNYRQKDLYEVAKHERLVRMVRATQQHSQTFMPLLSSALKLGILGFLVYRIAIIIYS
jgi:hypothetical protein